MNTENPKEGDTVVVDIYSITPSVNGYETIDGTEPNYRSDEGDELKLAICQNKFDPEGLNPMFVMENLVTYVHGKHLTWKRTEKYKMDENQMPSPNPYQIIYA